MMAAKSSKPQPTIQIPIMATSTSSICQGYVVNSQCILHNRPPQKEHAKTMPKTVPTHPGHTHSGRSARFSELSIAFCLLAIALPYQLNTGLA